MKDKRNTFIYLFGEKDARWLSGWAPLLILGLVTAVASPMLGQSTFGSVRGIAQDVSWAAVPDTKVVLHSTDENNDRTTAADSSGSFIFENVKAGHYTLSATHDGFAETVISAISVEARQDLRLTGALNVAGRA